jgi:peroxiredoxin
LLLLHAGRVASATVPPETESQVGNKIEGFSLPDFVGKETSLNDYADSNLVVVAFLGTECPIVKLYVTRLSEFHKRYKDKGVAFIGINANQQDSLTEIAHQAKLHKIEFPLLKDAGNKVADQFRAERTPEVFVLDAERVVRYHGRIDDQYFYEVQRSKADHNYLANALDELLAGKEVTTPYTKPVGCHIGRVLKADESSEVTYSNQIARILQKNCVECHRPGEIAPFSLTDYDEVVGWAEMIAEVVQEQRMPPWHADAPHGTFKNDRRLTDHEKKLIYDWVAAGAPQGDAKELPPPREFVEGWRIGEPDQIVKMANKPFQVPARGEVRYQYFVADPNWEEDKYIQAAEARAGNRAVVHHIIVAHNARQLASNLAHGVESEWITAMAPGSLPLVLEEGKAKLVPAGSKIVFQMHYTPNGTATEDLSYVGFKFADPKKVKYVVGTSRASNNRFEIPPGAANHKVEASMRFDRDSLMLAMFPHMHLRGKSFRYTAIYPDGREEVLLNIPHYDFNWQNGYVMLEPKLMPKGTRLHCLATFDNSEDNPHNPNPKAKVRWGDQTWEEMMIGYFDMCHAEADSPDARSRERTEKFLAAATLKEPRLNDELIRLATQATNSPREMLQFGAKLREVVPQLDRVCITTITGDKLTVEHVAQEAETAAIVGGAPVTLPSRGFALVKYASATEPQINVDLAQATQRDLKFMSRVFASSLHVPLTFSDKPATVNFWSNEPDAFGLEAITVLREAARLLTD